MKRAGSWAAEGLLWFGAVLGALSLLVGLLAVTGVVRPLVFTSGSMGSSIPEGSLAFSRTVEAGDIKVGDVVNVTRSDGQQVTHRVVDVELDGAQAQLTLQGDANPVPDAETYTVTEAHRVFADVPWLGHVAVALENPLLTLTLVLFLAALVMGPMLLKRGRQRGRRRRPSRRGGAPLAIAALAAASLTVGHVATPTLAGFTDSSIVTTASLSTHAMVPQAQPTCTDEGGILGLLGHVVVTWTHVDTRYEYVWQVIRVDNGLSVGSGVIPSPGNVGVTITHEIRTSLLALGLGARPLDLVIQARLKDAPQWVASSTTTPIRTASLLVGLSVRCNHR